MAAYYNENNPFCAQWLRNLIGAGLITDGDVDERDIREVEPTDLDGYKQCHFFAGIGGWSYALRLAGWPDDRPVWTGSCPCQDFSNAGKQAGFDGDRDLWPAWYRLIRERKPSIILGEQVDDSPEWYERAADDLEGDGYRFGAVVVPACAIRANHERARFWFVADASGAGLPLWNVDGEINRTPIPSAWREFERVHAEDSWEEREIESDVPVFTDGLPGRVEQTRAYGNAIVPQVAAEFISAYMEIA